MAVISVMSRVRMWIRNSDERHSALGENEISGVIRTEFGYQIVAMKESARTG